MILADTFLLPLMLLADGRWVRVPGHGNRFRRDVSEVLWNAGRDGPETCYAVASLFAERGKTRKKPEERSQAASLSVALGFEI